MPRLFLLLSGFFLPISAALALIWIQPSRFAATGGASPPLNDPFTGSAGALAAHWTVSGGAIELNGSGAAVYVSGTLPMARASGYTFASNQYHNLTSSADTQSSYDSIRVWVRRQADGSGYCVEYVSAFAAILLHRSDAGTLTELDRAYTLSSYGGGGLGIRASGSTISTYIGDGNGTEGVTRFTQVSATDSTYTGGTVAFEVSSGGSVTTIYASDL